MIAFGVAVALSNAALPRLMGQSSVLHFGIWKLAICSI